MSTINKTLNYFTQQLVISLHDLWFLVLATINALGGKCIHWSLLKTKYRYIFAAVPDYRTKFRLTAKVYFTVCTQAWETFLKRFPNLWKRSHASASKLLVCISIHTMQKGGSFLVKINFSLRPTWGTITWRWVLGNLLTQREAIQFY